MQYNRLLFLLTLLTCGGQAWATDYYLDNLHGNDRKPGTSPLKAWQSLSRASRERLQPGDRILLRSGDLWRERLEINGTGSAQTPIVISSYGRDGAARLNGLQIKGTHLTVQNLIIDADKARRDAVSIRNASHIRLHDMEIRNGTADGIDIQDSQDIHISKLLIHHFLAGSFENQKDAHGIVATNTQRLTIENTEIHHTSGDSFQSDTARDSANMSNDITIRNSHFWTSPLAEDFNAGWKATVHLPVQQHQHPGENAIDTKVVQRNWENAPRMRLTIDGLRAHGWKADAYITNKAVFNLKEQIAVTLNNIEVYDCEIAFRLRGNRGNALVSINNARIYQCDTAVRAEDGLHGLKISNSIFGERTGQFMSVIGKATRTSQPSWTLTNNLFHGTVPKVFRGNQNRSINDSTSK